MILRKMKTGYRLIRRECKKQRDILKQYADVKQQYSKLKKENKKYWVLAGIPLHGNLGDQAITLAEIKLLKEMDKEKEILEIPLPLMLQYPWLVKKIVGKEKILIQGGGYLGTLWMSGEIMVRKIIKVFKENVIIIFPQTVYFEEDKMEEYEKSRKIYSSHTNLHICTREESSYKIVCQMINKDNVHLVPDMVPYLKYNIKPDEKRSGALLCLRHDLEKVYSDNEKEKLCEILKSHFHLTIQETDTVIEHGVSREHRKDEVMKKIEEFSRVELVITDRLHGMVFAAIARTPCVALDNCNYKVRGVYQWIKNNKYVRYVQNNDPIEHIIEELLEMKESKYDNSPIQSGYEKLKQIIQNT